MNKNQKLTYLKKYGTNPLSYLTLSDSLSTYSGKWEGYIAYHHFLKTAIILGDPIVSSKDYNTVVEDIKNSFSSKKITLCFFLCKQNLITTLKQHGFKGLCFGQEALINLQKFDLSGKSKSSIRSSINYATKKHLHVEEYKYTRDKSQDIENEIVTTSHDWCKLQNMPELNFAFSHVDFNNYQDARYFTCRDGGKIVGFLTYYPIFGKNSYYLDLTRRCIDAPRGTIDYLLVKSIEQLKQENIQNIYIGGSPLYYQFVNSTVNSPFTTNLFTLLQGLFEFFYPTKSEFFFKNKYATDWEPYFIYYYPRFHMRIFLAIIDAVYNGGIASIALYKLKNYFC